MAAGQSISILVKVVDNASGPMSKIGGALSNLSGVAGRVGGPFAAMGQSLDGVKARLGGCGPAASQFGSALNQVNAAANETQGPLGRLRGALSGIATVAGGTLLAGGIAGVAQSVVGMGQEALGAVTGYERLQMQFESMVARELRAKDATLEMGAALEAAGPKAQALIAWVEKLAIESPFSSQDVQGAFRTAMAFGFTSDQAKSLTEATLNWAAATGAQGDQMQRVSMAVGQMSAKGKVSAEELLQLSEAGVNVNAILQKMGVSYDQVGKKAIPSGAFIKEFATTLQDEYGVAAKRQAGTLGGLIASLGDLKEFTLRDFFGGMFKSAQPYLEKMVVALQNPQVRESIKGWGDSLGKVMAGFFSFGEKVATTLANVAGVIRGALGGLSGIGKDLGGVFDPLLASFQRLPVVGELSKGLGNLLGGDLVGAIQAMSGSINAVAAGLAAVLGPVFDQFKEIPLLGDLTSAMASTLRGNFGAASTSLTHFQATVARVIGDVRSLFSRLGSVMESGGLAGVISQMAREITPIGATFTKAFSSVREAIVTFIAQSAQSLGNWIGPQIPAMIQSVADLGRAVAQTMADQLPVIVGQLARWGKAFFDWALNTGGPMLMNGLQQALSGIGIFLQENLPNIKDAIGGMFQVVADLGGAIFVQTLIALETWIANVVEWLSGPGKDTASAGFSVAFDVVPAIINKLIEAANAVVSLGGPMLYNANRRLGIIAMQGLIETYNPLKAVTAALGGIAALGDKFNIPALQSARNVLGDIASTEENMATNMVNMFMPNKYSADYVDQWKKNQAALNGYKSELKSGGFEVKQPVVVGSESPQDVATGLITGARRAGDIYRNEVLRQERANEALRLRLSDARNKAQPQDTTGGGIWDSLTKNIAGGGGMGKARDAMRSRAESLAKEFQSAFDSVFKATKVTPEDLSATAAGKYVDKWDEAARRIRDIFAKGAGSPFANMIPDNVRAGGDEAIKRWALQTVGEFYKGLRPDMVNWDAVKTMLMSPMDKAIAEGNIDAFNDASLSITPQIIEYGRKMGVDLVEAYAGQVSSKSAIDNNLTALGQFLMSDPAMVQFANAGTTAGTKFVNAMNDQVGSMTVNTPKFKVEVNVDLSKGVSDATGGAAGGGGGTVPQFAEGGILKHTPGRGRLFVGAEKEDEVIMPMSKLRKAAQSGGGILAAGRSALSGVMERVASRTQANVAQPARGAQVAKNDRNPTAIIRSGLSRVMARGASRTQANVAQPARGAQVARTTEKDREMLAVLMTRGLPRLTRNIPKMANGGILPYKPGGALFVGGEKEPEAVMPMSWLHRAQKRSSGETKSATPAATTISNVYHIGKVNDERDIRRLGNIISAEQKWQARRQKGVER